jgi:quinolinate synthase
MGRNLAQLFASMAHMSDEEVRAVHPAHTQASIRSLLPRLHYFDEGTCIVHHMFGAETTSLVRKAYGDALLTAHFEVPGEMFSLAMEAKTRGRGVVGSTSNILDFIADHVTTALQQPFREPLQVVLGTEAGLITAIVDKVQQMLRAAGRPDVAVEVVFPVAPDAVVSEQTVGEAQLPGGLAIVPGPAGGEGCSTEGGCASCPYMKMNTLQALQSVCDKVGGPAEALLEGFKPRAYVERVGERSMASLGCEPILHMRGFQKAGRLPQQLESDIQARAK